MMSLSHFMFQGGSRAPPSGALAPPLRVFNAATMLTRSSFQRVLLPQPLSKQTSFPIASVARDQLHKPRFSSLQAKCFSTSLVVELDTVEWKEVDIVADVSEVIDFTDHGVDNPDGRDDSVTAFSFGPSVDVKTPDKSNCVSYHYVGEEVVLRFDNTKPWTIGLGFSGAAISPSDIGDVVVFNNDSVILLVGHASEINERLEIVEVHASDVHLSSLWPLVDRDLLPREPPMKVNIYREMHKIGTYGLDILLKPHKW